MGARIRGACVRLRSPAHSRPQLCDCFDRRTLRDIGIGLSNTLPSCGTGSSGYDVVRKAQAQAEGAEGLADMRIDLR